MNASPAVSLPAGHRFRIYGFALEGHVLRGLCDHRIKVEDGSRLERRERLDVTFPNTKVGAARAYDWCGRLNGCAR